MIRNSYFKLHYLLLALIALVVFVIGGALVIQTPPHGTAPVLGMLAVAAGAGVGLSLGYLVLLVGAYFYRRLGLRRLLLITLLIGGMLLLTVPMLAEDGTAVTDTGTLTPETGSMLVIIISSVALGALAGGGLIAILDRLGRDKAFMDSTEKLYLSYPPETKETIRSAVEVINRVADMLDRMTDGQPNELPLGQGDQVVKTAWPDPDDGGVG